MQQNLRNSLNAAKSLKSNQMLTNRWNHIKCYKILTNIKCYNVLKIEPMPQNPQKTNKINVFELFKSTQMLVNLQNRFQINAKTFNYFKSMYFGVKLL